MMNVLLIYPKYPDTFWSFKHALKFVSKKAVNPPLGLITVAAMLPGIWSKKLIDLNVQNLTPKQIQWADLIFISAMNIQSKSAIEIIDRCKSLNKTIVAGGPMFTESWEDFKDVDHFVLNEAEITLPRFLDDLNLNRAKRIYQSEVFADMTQSPMPDYSLVDISKYNTLNLQYTRGCPFNCEFCDITALLGHKVRTKSTAQVLLELDNIYLTGWRKNVFFVDDNFIGNARILKTDLLPALINWMNLHNYPFAFTTEASINLADDEELMEMMSEAGFSNVFIGIETTEEASLSECGKVQNKNRSLVDSVHKIQDHGFEVSGGFIVGFDNDSKSVFQNQIEFIKATGIVSAMVGLLNAPKRTRLYKRLKKEGRIVGESNGNNTDINLNFIPRMESNELLKGYRKVINGIYSGEAYYKRALLFIKRFEPNQRHRIKPSFSLVLALIRSVFVLGIFDRYRKFYWEIVVWSLRNRPSLVTKAVTYSVYGYHFRKVYKNVLNN